MDDRKRWVIDTIMKRRFTGKPDKLWILSSCNAILFAHLELTRGAESWKGKKLNKDLRLGRWRGK